MTGREPAIALLGNGVDVIDMTKFGQKAAVAGVAGAGSLAMLLGIGAGSASAAPPSPAGSGMHAPQDRGWHHDRDHDRGWRGAGHARRDGRAPGIYINLPCVTGPYGVVTWCP